MKNALLIVFLSVFTFQCAAFTAPFSKKSQITNVTVEKDKYNSDIFIVTFTFKTWITRTTVNERGFKDRRADEFQKILEENNYVAYTVIDNFQAQGPPHPIWKESVEVHFFKTEEEFDKWIERYKK